MFCTIAVIVALILGLAVGAAGGFLVWRNNKAKFEALDRAAGELKK
jgi:uncharacterized Tic20 family protein